MEEWRLADCIRILKRPEPTAVEERMRENGLSSHLLSEILKVTWEIGVIRSEDGSWH